MSDTDLQRQFIAAIPCPTLDVDTVKVRATSLVCIDHPEWGTWGVMDDCGLWWNIHGQRGSRILSKSEAAQFWRIA